MEPSLKIARFTGLLYLIIMIAAGFSEGVVRSEPIAGAFFGVHLLLLGFLLYRSRLFPKILGMLITLAAFGYLIESTGNFLVPGNEVALAWVVAVPAVLGEFSLTLWLLVKGIKTNES